MCIYALSHVPRYEVPVGAKEGRGEAELVRIEQDTVVVEVISVVERKVVGAVRVFEGTDLLGGGKVNGNSGARRLGTSRGCG
jgi:hypothetical protein